MFWKTYPKSKQSSIRFKSIKHLNTYHLSIYWLYTKKELANFNSNSYNYYLCIWKKHNTKLWLLINLFILVGRRHRSVVDVRQVTPVVNFSFWINEFCDGQHQHRTSPVWTLYATTYVKNVCVPPALNNLIMVPYKC